MSTQGPIPSLSKCLQVKYAHEAASEAHESENVRAYLNELGICVAEGVHCNTSSKVQVTPALRVPHIATLPSLQN